MNRRTLARISIVCAMLALAEPTPKAVNASVDNLAVSVSVATSCQVTHQPGVVSTDSAAADIVALQCANGANATPQLWVSDSVESATDSADATHRVVTIHF